MTIPTNCNTCQKPVNTAKDVHVIIGLGPECNCYTCAGLKPLICVFDLETTGLPSEADVIGIVQLAAIIIDPNLPGWPEFDHFHAFLRLQPDAFRSPIAMQMHRKKARTETYFKMVGDEPATVYSRFERWLQSQNEGRPELVLCGHNAASFDVPLLARDMRRWGFDLNGQKGQGRMADHHTIDTAGMAFDRYGLLGTNELTKVSLEPLAKFLGVEFDKEKAHDAMYDVRVTADILRKMKGVN